MYADLVIVGNGMAGNRLLQELVKQPQRPQRVVVFGEEPRPAYNRVLLSPLLAQELEADAVELHDRQWYADQGIELICADPIEQVDLAAKRVHSREGRTLHYERLVFATGSRSLLPPIPGIELDGVMGFRSWDDVERMRRYAERGGNAVVVGGGLLGLEAAEGLRKLGMQVCVLQRGGYLLNRQLDVVAAGLLQDTLEQRGLEVLIDIGIEQLVGHDGHVREVMLQDGRCLPVDLVVVAAGVAPEIGVASAAGLRCNRAIEVDAHLHTSALGVYALGECCEFESNTYGLVAPIWRQAQVLASVLSGKVADYSEQPVATQLKVSGVELFSCGEIDAEGTEVVQYLDPELREYRRLWLRDGRLVGAVLYGDTRLGPWYFDLLTKQRDLAPLRDQLLFDSVQNAPAA